MKKIRHIVGIDAGGTKIRGVLACENKVLKRVEALHHSKIVTAKKFLKTLFSVLDKLQKPHIIAVGIGLPGTITDNQVMGAGMVKALNQIDIKKSIEEKYKTRVFLDNDVNVALRAESKNLKQYNSIFMLTLGTGIGGGWFKDGTIMRGSFSTAYEIGQMIIDTQLQKAFEKYACGAEFFRNKGYDPIESEHKARAGNMTHKKLWQEFGTNLGIALANTANLIEPEAFVIGGGLAHAWPLFIPHTRRTMKKLILSLVARKKIKIIKAKLGKWGGAIGAMILVADSLHSQKPRI